MDNSSIDLDFNKNPKHFGIKSDVVMKLLPYDGFYPVNRTLQLGTLFFSSYSPGAKFKNAATAAAGDVYWRTLLRPFFAPGILYNSIKSGIAVDHPIRRSNRNHGQYNEVGMLSTTLHGCLSGTITVSAAGQIPGNTRRFDPDRPFDFTNNTNVDKFFWADRLPFESIFSPETYLKYSDNIAGPGWTLSSDINTLLHAKTDGISGSIDETLLDNNQVEDYQLAVSNFMAAVPSFFLKKKTCANGEPGHLTKFVSSIPGGSTDQGTSLGQAASAPRTVNVNKNYVYMMEIGLKKTDLFNMYSNPYAFGTPTATGSLSWDSYASTNGSAAVPTGQEWPRHRGEFAPFTPSYFYGPSIVRLIFAPDESTDLTLNEILTSPNLYQEFINENGSYYDFSSGSFTDLDGNPQSTSGTPPYGWNRAWQNRMDIDASIVIDNKFPTDSGKIKPSDPNKWVVMPKWECPILDFDPQTKAPAYNFSSSIDSGLYSSLTYGMWHQYGQMPDTNQGVYLFLRDVGAKDTEFRLVGNPAGTAAAPATANILPVNTNPSTLHNKIIKIETTTATVQFTFNQGVPPGSPTGAGSAYIIGCNAV